MFTPTKRINPFGDEEHRAPQRPNTNIFSPFDAQYTLMQNRQPTAHARTPSRTQDVDMECEEECVVCKTVSSCAPCSHCEEPSCDLCLRQCEKCQDSFCTFCSTVNYDKRTDRYFCLLCNGEESKGTKIKNMGSSMGDVRQTMFTPYHATMTC